ncbi:MAG: hypothetical protein K9G67_15485 [Bacteroidales bacterium]|nr:hypothetical protein [Bacteroidales bacterium]MCF8343890.1 hypothetical protein [Bacteroidales bacterium]MCF8352666.1 hypothetical protein [Bacteroidales bacterium]MCF8377758.1 hypothetical protein [Bacteroidales bacterium]
MKQFTLLSLFTALIFTSAIIISGCTKEGPQGPAGTDGTDGTAGCVKCHDDSQNIYAASVQWEASTHATGGNFERNAASCGACHTSQGFLQRIANGTMEADGTVENPAPINCYACHQIHETYTEEDWAFTASGPVEFWIDGTVADMGKANLCAQCHQSRVPDPIPVPGGGDVEITSIRYGPHHGPQGNMLAGSGGYEVEGSLGYNSSLHTELVENGCVTCHMADAYGAQAGGHTMGMSYIYHGHAVVNDAGCVACHEGEDIDEKVEEAKADIDVLLADLKGLLIEQGVLDSSDYAITGTMTSNQAGAIFNYQFVREDRSGGTHNFKYAKALLTNSIESIN